MALSPLVKTKAIIDKTWDKVWSAIKDHTFTVSVENQVEIPTVEFPEIKFPEIPEAKDITPELKDIVNSILEQTKELKSTPDSSATKKELLNILEQIHAILSIDKKDFTPDLVTEIGALRNDLSKIGSQIPKTDLKPVQDSIEALGEALDFKGLEKFQRFDDWKVYINEKQFDKLVKSMSVSVSTAAGSSVMRTASGEVSESNPVPVDLFDKSSGNSASINSEGQLHVVLMGKVDTGNSSTTPLGNGGVFTGTAFDTLDYGFIFVTIFADQDSATDGLSFQQSSDGTNWDNTDNYSYTANTGKTYSVQPAAKWFRVVYTNGTTPQGAFRLSTVFKKTSSLSSSHKVSETISADDDGTLNISVIKGQNPSGAYVDFDATTAGNFKVSLEEYDDVTRPWRRDLEGIGDITVGTSQVEIAITGTPTYDIRIRADKDNTGIIYIGKTGVLSDGSNDFVRLHRGDEVILPYDDVDNALYAISDTAGQKINVGASL